MIRWIALLLAALIAVTGCSGGGADVAAPDPALESPVPAPAVTATPPGASTLIRGEARILRGTSAQPLLHPIRKMRAAYSFTEDGRRIDYDIDKDLVVTPTGIARPRGSRVPDFDDYSYSPQTPCERSLLSAECARAIQRCPVGGERCQTDYRGNSTFWFRSEPRNPGLSLSYVTYFDYEAHVEDANIPARAIRRNIASVLCLGDSITAGAHTVENYVEGTDGQSWCGHLRSILGQSATVTNASLGGGRIDDIRKASAIQRGAAPDVVIIAVGMNDHVAGPAGLQAFGEGLEALARTAQSNGASVLLVGFFQQNPLWVEEVPADTVAYNEKIAEVAVRLDVPFIDIGRAFAEASPTQEPYYHLTGDYMHHPNNYGQRIYFSLLLPYFLDRPVPASSIPDYVQGPWSNR